MSHFFWALMEMFLEYIKKVALRNDYFYPWLRSWKRRKSGARFPSHKKNRNQSLSRSHLSRETPWSCSGVSFVLSRIVCILPSVYNNAKDGITADCSRYPLALIRMHYWCRRHICLPRMISNIKWSRMICSTRIDYVFSTFFLFSILCLLLFLFFSLFYSPGFSLSYFYSLIFLLSL